MLGGEYGVIIAEIDTLELSSSESNSKTYRHKQEEVVPWLPIAAAAAASALEKALWFAILLQALSV